MTGDIADARLEYVRKELFDDAQAEIARLREELEKNSGDLSYSDLMEHSRISSFQIKEYRAEITTLQKQLERAVKCLNELAAWEDGNVVGSHFDNPGAASASREALADIQKMGVKK